MRKAVGVISSTVQRACAHLAGLLGLVALVGCGSGEASSADTSAPENTRGPETTAAESPTSQTTAPEPTMPPTIPPETVVPDVVGLSRECAEAFLAERGLRWRYDGTEAVRSVPVGALSEPPPREPTILIVPPDAIPTPEVLTQDPGPGTGVPAGAMVVFATRGGPELVRGVPMQPPGGVPGPEATCGSSLAQRRQSSP